MSGVRAPSALYVFMLCIAILYRHIYIYIYIYVDFFITPRIILKWKAITKEKYFLLIKWKFYLRFERVHFVNIKMPHSHFWIS